MRSVYDVVKRPVISEKGTILTEDFNTYVFEVDRTANKHEIRDAIQTLFNVKVDQVRTMISHGKIKRVGANFKKRPNWKKALVKVAEGQKIEYVQSKK